jgi:hypothetical protein
LPDPRDDPGDRSELPLIDRNRVRRSPSQIQKLLLELRLVRVTEPVAVKVEVCLLVVVVADNAAITFLRGAYEKFDGAGTDVLHDACQCLNDRARDAHRRR